MEKNIKSDKATSWGKVAKWYDNMVEKDSSSYQQSLILPNILRLIHLNKGESVLDLACGQGFFSREFAKLGVAVTGVDIAAELIAIAKEASEKAGLKIDYRVSSADKLGFIKSGTVDKITIVLAIQNIENLNGVFAECSRVLKPHGKLLMVLNHPTFRVPKQSSWEFTADNKAQYRRIDEYMSESKIEIQMHPGDKPREKTVSFHRPLQVYFKAFRKAGLAVTNLEEWVSNKKSEPGPRAKAEDGGRKEIPLFMFVEAEKQ